MRTSHVYKDSQHVSSNKDVSVIYVTRVSSFEMPQPCMQRWQNSVMHVLLYKHLCWKTFPRVLQAVIFSIMDSRAVQTHAQGEHHHHNSHNVGSQQGKKNLI